MVFRVLEAGTSRLHLNFLLPKPSNPFSSSLVLAYIFAGLIILGTILLVLPISSAAGTFTSPVDAIFTATSAVCVTGLVVVDTGTYWSTFGQGVIFGLFQLGGLGFIVGAALLLLAIGGKFGLRDRLLISETMGADRIGGLLGLVFRVAIFIILIELVGATILYFQWTASGDTGSVIWKSIFSAASAFNNCGMDLNGGFRSFMGFQNDPITLLVIALLLILGSTGFSVLGDLVAHRSFRKISLDSKLVIIVSTVLIGLGTLVYLVAEWDNPFTLGPLLFPQKLLAAFFQSIVPRTAGFNSIDIGGLNQITLYFTILLMFIGGASGSTAGGVKVNTLGVLATTFISVLKGRERVSAFGRQVPTQLVFRALTLFLFYLAMAGLVVAVLSATETFSFDRILFETFSALGTVGLSTGITPDLSMAGRCILILAMYAGRLAPLGLMAYMVNHRQRVDLEYPHENVRLG